MVMLTGELTPGQMYYYGGIGLAIVGIVALILSVVVCERNKKNFIKNLENETE